MSTTTRSANADPIPSRRAALATIGSALTITGVSAAIVAPVLAGPEPDAIATVVDEASDPLLSLVTAYKAGYAEWASSLDEATSDEENDRLAEALVFPHLRRLQADDCPQATTLAGAVAALRAVVFEMGEGANIPDRHVANMIRAAAAFFDRRAS
jgi:hypothetical protein